jgi:hypothetical protein
MEIKTKYHLGDEVIYEGEKFAVQEFFCKNLKNLILKQETDPSISLRLYQNDRRAYEFVDESEVEPINSVSPTDAARAIYEVAIKDLKPDRFMPSKISDANPDVPIHISIFAESTSLFVSTLPILVDELEEFIIKPGANR